MNLYRVTFHYAASTRIASHYIDVKALDKSDARLKTSHAGAFGYRRRVVIELLDNALIEEPRQ